MGRINDIDARVLDALSGRDKIKALLSDNGLTLSAFAKKRNFWVEHVSRCLSGDRAQEEIRDALADELELSREKIDELIDGTPVGEPSPST